MADAAEQSKRAEKRARQKANKAAAAAGEAPAVAIATPKPEANGGYPAGAKAKAAAAPPVAAAKAKAQAAPEPEPKAKAKAKAKGAAAEPKAEPKAAAQPKGKAAAAPAPKAKAAAAPAPEAPKAKATQPAAKAKQAAGKKVVEQEEPAERPKVERIEEMRPVVVDDGIGDWEVSANSSKKDKKRQEKQAQQAAEAAAAKAAAQKVVPGMGPTGPAVNSIPGMEPTKAEKKAAAKAAAAAPVAAPTAAAATEEAPAAKPGSIVTINVPENKIGRIIGPKGATLKMLQEKTGVTRIDTEGEKFTITGEPNAVAMAETAMKEMIEKGYMSITFDNFSEDSLQVHPSAFPDLIGKQGAIIRKIKEELRAEVELPPVPKNGHPAKKYKVTIAGSKDAVVKAKEVINSIMMYYHHELTHPGEVHEELEVVDWQLRFVIGKGGSEMRHIQKNFNVKVYVPREHSMNQMTVIVGERVNVDRAKAYIEKMLWNAEHAPKGRDRAEGAGDDHHEEEEQEPWMDQYMFKRRR